VPQRSRILPCKTPRPLQVCLFRHLHVERALNEELGIPGRMKDGVERSAFVNDRTPIVVYLAATLYIVESATEFKVL